MIFEFISEIVWSDRSNKRPKNQTGNIRTGSEQMRNMLSAAAPSLEDLKLSLSLSVSLSGGVTHKRRCTFRPSVIYLIVNKLLSLSVSLTHSLTLTPRYEP
jgi:hypothetical protein